MRWCRRPPGVPGEGNLTILRQTRHVGEWEFEGPVIEWRGPAPFVFVDIPRETSDELKIAAAGVEYWGQVPVVARIHGVEFFTALFPKDGRYLLPVKKAAQRDAGVAVGGMVAVALRVERHRPPGL